MAKNPTTSVSFRPTTTQQGSLTEMLESKTPYERDSKLHSKITQAMQSMFPCYMFTTRL